MVRPRRKTNQRIESNVAKHYQTNTNGLFYCIPRCLYFDLADFEAQTAEIFPKLLSEAIETFLNYVCLLNSRYKCQDINENVIFDSPWVAGDPK